ncbi:MAG: aminotransferase class V-fold PLP-dependent enzyme [Saprospiraceae bacterium]|nr:aminotransferase class V-fold PLP-dependent enzyme [Saprospiraceae bacterium]
MSPLLLSVEEAGIEGMRRKRNPAIIDPIDFFTQAESLRQDFATLIGGDAQNVAILPSASYGLMSATSNLPKNNGQYALVVAEEFPSGYYAIDRWCREQGKTLKIISPPEDKSQRARKWNQLLLEAINYETAVVLISSVHWTDGSIFDLKAIGERCKACDTCFIVDGTQSVGAMPINVNDCHIDALVCAGYKWLLGPYNIGLAYYSTRFANGRPIEESWMNRSEAEDFQSLTAYRTAYTPGAGRYNMGEFSSFIHAPMLQTAIRQILKWTPQGIQGHCQSLTAPLLDFLASKGCLVEENEFRSNHMFGFRLPEHVDAVALMTCIKAKQIFVSRRGTAIRVSTHVYNTREDMDTLMEVMDDFFQA